MKMQMLGATLATVAAVAILGCGKAAVPHTITLASGSQLNVIDEKPVPYQDRHGAEQHDFMVMYVSAQNFEDPTALRNEMYEVFDFYKPHIDEGGFAKLVLTPAKRDLGGGWEGRPFYLERRPSGRWIVL